MAEKVQYSLAIIASCLDLRTTRPSLFIGLGCGASLHLSVLRRPYALLAFPLVRPLEPRITGMVGDVQADC